MSRFAVDLPKACEHLTRQKSIASMIKEFYLSSLPLSATSSWAVDGKFWNHLLRLRPIFFFFLANIVDAHSALRALLFSLLRTSNAVVHVAQVSCSYSHPNAAY